MANMTNETTLYLGVGSPFYVDKVGKSLVLISKSCRATIVQLATGSGYKSEKVRRPTRMPSSFRLWYKHNESQCQRSRVLFSTKGQGSAVSSRFSCSNTCQPHRPWQRPFILIQVHQSIRLPKKERKKERTSQTLHRFSFCGSLKTL